MSAREETEYVLTTYCVLGTVFRIACMFSHSVLAIILFLKPCFTAEKVKAR